MLATVFLWLAAPRGKGNAGRYAGDEAWQRLCGSSGDPPTLCPALPEVAAGEWRREAMRAAALEFAALYARRPIDVNPGGMNANQGFSAWYTLRTLRPPVVIESGGARGQMTWMIRQVLPEARVWSLDPHLLRAGTIGKFFDASPRTTHWRGGAFVDVGAANWSALLPTHDRHRALVILDDHMSSVRRIDELTRHGFKHFWYDDKCARVPRGPRPAACGVPRPAKRPCRVEPTPAVLAPATRSLSDRAPVLREWRSWKYNEADCYSFNRVCSPLGKGAATYHDYYGRLRLTIPPAEHEANNAYMRRMLRGYLELPPLWDSCTSPRAAALPAERQPLLTEAEALNLTAALFARSGKQRAALAADGARSDAFRAHFGVSWFAPYIWARARPPPSEYAALVAGTSLTVAGRVMAKG